MPEPGNTLAARDADFDDEMDGLDLPELLGPPATETDSETEMRKEKR